MLCPHAEAYNTLLSDNFNGENGGHAQLNYTGFVNWDVTAGSGTVDLIGLGSQWDYYPGNGLYVDLDGSTNNPGILTTKNPFTFVTANDYRLTFNLGGSHLSGSPSDSVTIKVGLGTYYEIFTLPWNAGLTLVSRDMWLHVPDTGKVKLSFENGGSDNMGLILDNVLLTEYNPRDVGYKANPATPELSSGALLLFGMLPVGLAWRRRRKSA